jgi:hypothetical protein
MPRRQVDLLRKIGPERRDGRWPWQVLDGEHVVAAGDARSRWRAERKSQRAAEHYIDYCRAMGEADKRKREATEGVTLETWV